MDTQIYSPPRYFLQTWAILIFSASRLLLVLMIPLFTSWMKFGMQPTRKDSCILANWNGWARAALFLGIASISKTLRRPLSPSIHSSTWSLIKEYIDERMLGRMPIHVFFPIAMAIFCWMHSMDCLPLYERMYRLKLASRLTFIVHLPKNPAENSVRISNRQGKKKTNRKIF